MPPKVYGEFGEVEYDGGVEYRDGVLEAIYAPDGRLVAEYPSGSNRVLFPYAATGLK